MGKDDKKDNVKGNINIDIGLGGLFKGLGSLIDLASELAEKSESIKKEGVIGDDKDLKAVYGVSVKFGTGGKATVQQFGNVKEKKQGPIVDEIREPMVDIFDEGDYILVIAEMPGVSETEIKYEIKGDILILSGEKKERKYYKEILLSAPVDEEKTKYSNRNGIVEIKLWKQKNQD
ncbi:Hsp20/alpha crystallin family protein [Candidatus Poribacteria bacterium]|nr:Hsp20/alpha crystallin family protein [Candidatus Poribacteria bacterium]